MPIVGNEEDTGTIRKKNFCQPFVIFHFSIVGVWIILQAILYPLPIAHYIVTIFSVIKFI